MTLVTRRHMYLFVAVLAIAVFAALGGAATARAASFTLAKGSTQLAVSPLLAFDMVSGGYDTLALTPAQLLLTPGSFTYKAPVTGGSWNPTTGAGIFRLSGGMTIFAYNGGGGWNTLALTRWQIKLGASPSVSAIVNGGTRQVLFDLNQAAANINNTTSGGYKRVRITGLPAIWTTAGAAAFNGVFGTTLPPTAPEGTFTISARSL
jgi:hypothetical protein